MLITVNGLVIRSYPSGNHDSVLHILTDTNGKLTVMVKGGGSKKNSSSAGYIQLLTYGNYEIYQGKDDLYWLRGGSVIESFFTLTNDLSSMALANYLCEVASECSRENFEIEDTHVLLRLLLNSLYMLKTGGRSVSVVKGVFELRVCAMLGYTPDLIGCADCGEAFPDEAYLDVMNGRFVCSACQAKRNRALSLTQIREEDEFRQRRVICHLSSSVLAAMRYALSAPDKRIFSFTLQGEEEGSFERVCETFLLHHLERDFKTLEFYRSTPDLDKLVGKGG